MSSLRILHICGAFLPEYGGGTTETTRDIAVLQAAAGHRVSILCCTSRAGEPYSLLEENAEGLNVLRVVVPDLFHRDPEGFLMNWPERLRHERRVREVMGAVLARVQPDIVDYHVNRPLGEEALLALDRAGIPVVASLHDFWMICARVTFMRSPSNQPCSGPGPIRCFVCMYSHYDGSVLKALPKLAWRIPRLGLGIAWKMHRRRLALKTIRAGLARSGALSDAHAPLLAGSCAPLLHGISIPADKPPARAAWDGPLRFGFFGGAAPTKGLGDVLEAARRLRGSGLKFELHVFGPGHVEASPQVIVHGLFSSEKRGEAYGSIDAAVMATHMYVEPRGRIPEEASYWGVPSIVPRIGGLVDVVRDEVDGLLYRFRDINDLERQMKRLLEEPLLLKRLRGNLRLPAQLGDSLGKIEAVYRQAIAAGAAER